MAFWSTQYDATDRDPKRAFKFKIIFEGAAGGQEIIWWAKKVGKPSFDVTEATHSFLDKEFYFPGRVQWQTVSMTLVDPVAPVDAVAQTNALIAAQGYDITDSPTDALKTMSKGKAAVALGDVRIVQLDSEGVEIETWTLQAPFVKKVSFGELSYDTDDLVEIELELRYDLATCEVASEGSKASGASSVAPGTSFHGRTASS